MADMATPTAPEAPVRRGADWLESWTPEDPENWDSGRAWKTLWVTTFNLTLAFATWFLVSALAPKLNNIGYDLSKGQLYWLVAIPGLAGGTLRLIWTFLPPIMGTRKLVTITSALFVLPAIGWGLAVQNPDTPYAVLLFLAALAGIGGGAFSGFMPSTSYFFPKAKQGTALGLQAGLGNFGVSLVQFVTPWIVGLSIVGASQRFIDVKKGVDKEVWYQNAGFIWVPFIIVGVILAWTLLRSVPVQARGVKDQMDIFSNKHTWLMTVLYVITFGTFSGLAAQFGLLIKNLFGADAFGAVRSRRRQVRVLGRADRLSSPDHRRPDRRPRRRREGHPRGHRGHRRGRCLHLHHGVPGLRRRVPHVLLGHDHHLLLHRGRQRLDVQADADDLQAATGRWRDRMDRRHRRLRSLHLRRPAGLSWPRGTFFAGLAVFALIGTAITWHFYAKPGAEMPS